MGSSLEFIWVLPVAIGIGMAYYFIFAAEDQGANADDKQHQAKTEDQ
jgi:hypothetical protein